MKTASVALLYQALPPPFIDRLRKDAKAGRIFERAVRLDEKPNRRGWRDVRNIWHGDPGECSSLTITVRNFQNIRGGKEQANTGKLSIISM